MDIKKEPVVIVYAILAALQVVNGALATTDVFDEDVAGIIAIVIGAITAGAAFYVRSLVSPWEEVVSQIKDGHVVAGPASTGGNTLPTDPPPADPSVGPKGF
jgi:hypothetical protein